MKKVASYSVLLLVVILGVLPLWGKDAYLVFPFEDKTEQNLSEEARSAFNIALFATGKGDVIPYHLRSPMVKRLIADGSLKEEEVTSVPSDDRAVEIGKLFGANYVFLGSIEELKEEEGTISVMERARMLSVAEGKQLKEAVVTGKSRGKVNGVSREAAIKEALDDAARSLVSALVGAPAPTTKPAEIRRKERSNYYLLGAILLGWVVWSQTREEEKGAAAYVPRVDAVSYGSTVDISWNPASGASRYKIMRATIQNTPQGAPWNIQVIKDVKTLPYEDLWEVYPPQTGYTDTDVRIGNAYAYCVVAIGKGGEELGRAYSSLIIVGAPPVPSGVTAIKIASQTKSYIEIDWQAVVGASSYRIYRGVSQDGPFELIGSVTGTQLLDTNPLTGTVYYKVSALSSQGAEGLASTPIQPTPETPVPTPP
jgi:hypothetical protein